MSSSSEARPRSGGLYYWYGAVAGIWWWLVHLAVQAALVPYVCHSPEQVWTIHVLTWGTVAATLIGLPPVVRAWRRRERIGLGGISWWGEVGVYLNLASVALIIAEYIPIFFIDFCAA